MSRAREVISAAVWPYLDPGGGSDETEKALDAIFTALEAEGLVVADRKLIQDAANTIEALLGDTGHRDPRSVPIVQNLIAAAIRGDDHA